MEVGRKVKGENKNARIKVLKKCTLKYQRMSCRWGVQCSLADWMAKLQKQDKCESGWWGLGPYLHGRSTKNWTKDKMGVSKIPGMERHTLRKLAQCAIQTVAWKEVQGSGPSWVRGPSWSSSTTDHRPWGWSGICSFTKRFPVPLSRPQTRECQFKNWPNSLWANRQLNQRSWN